VTQLDFQKIPKSQNHSLQGKPEFNFFKSSGAKNNTICASKPVNKAEMAIGFIIFIGFTYFIGAQFGSMVSLPDNSVIKSYQHNIDVQNNLLAQDIIKRDDGSFAEHLQALIESDNPDNELLGVQTLESIASYSDFSLSYTNAQGERDLLNVNRGIGLLDSNTFMNLINLANNKYNQNILTNQFYQQSYNSLKEIRQSCSYGGIPGSLLMGCHAIDPEKMAQNLYGTYTYHIDNLQKMTNIYPPMSGNDTNTSGNAKSLKQHINNSHHYNTMTKAHHNKI
jgi:hypothetical protein